MSIHSEIEDNSEVKLFIENLCRKRWETKSQPCKHCKYRYPIEDESGMDCMFPSMPIDWPLLEKRA